MMKRSPARLLLALAFLIGALLSELATHRFGFPRPPGTFLSWNLSLLSWQLVDAVGGDFFGLIHPWVIRIVLDTLHGAILTIAVGTFDRLVRTSLGFSARIASFALVVSSYSVFLLLAFPIKEFVHVRWSADIGAPTDTLLWRASGIFERDVNLGRRRPIMFVSAPSSRFRETLANVHLVRHLQLLFLNASFEIAFSPSLSPSLAAQSLARDHLVILTTDSAITKDLSNGKSLTSVLDDARTGKLKLLQLDPAAHAAGLATLLLEARIKGAINPESGEIDKVAAEDILTWLPQRVTLLRPRFGVFVYPSGEVGDADGIAAMKRPGSVVLLSEASCAALRRAGVALRAVYPPEGTMVLDYPAILNTSAIGSTEEQKEVARKFLSFLTSAKAQKMRESSGLGGKCVEGEPPKVLTAPPPQAVRALLNAWLERNKAPEPRGN